MTRASPFAADPEPAARRQGPRADPGPSFPARHAAVVAAAAPGVGPYVTYWS